MTAKKGRNPIKKNYQKISMQVKDKCISHKATHIEENSSPFPLHQNQNLSFLLDVLISFHLNYWSHVMNMVVLNPWWLLGYIIKTLKVFLCVRTLTHSQSLLRYIKLRDILSCSCLASWLAHAKVRDRWKLQKTLMFNSIFF